jgi:hypothetical protein
VCDRRGLLELVIEVARIDLLVDAVVHRVRLSDDVAADDRIDHDATGRSHNDRVQAADRDHDGHAADPADVLNGVTIVRPHPRRE